MEAPAGPIVLIVGYFGYGNGGDEAILAAMVKRLRSDHPSKQIVVASGDPASTRALHEVEAVHIQDIEAVTESARQSACIVLGGGGLFHDYWEFDTEDLLTSTHSGLGLLNSFVVLSVALDKPLVVYGVGVGPVATAAGARFTRSVFEAAVYASVRDLESLEILEGIGADTSDIDVVADPVFVLAGPTGVTRPHTDTASRPTVGVALRQWDIEVSYEHWIREIAQGLDLLVNAHEVDVAFLPFQSKPWHLANDQEVAERVSSWMEASDRTRIVSAAGDPAALIEAVSGCEVVIGMRLHSIIIAASLEVPSIGIIYDGKLRNAMRLLGHEDLAIPLHSLSASSLANTFASLWSRRTAIRESLVSTLGPLRYKADAGLHKLSEAVGREGQGRDAPLAQVMAPALLANTLRADRTLAQLNQERRDWEQKRATLEERERELIGIKESRTWRYLQRIGQIRTALGLRGPRRRLELETAADPATGSPPAASTTAHQPLVSVVLPVYNHQEHLPGAVRSVLEQTYKTIELIIVDDGSTKPVEEVLEPLLGDERIRLYRQTNQKLPAALTNGFARAKGDFLTWTSADNEMAPTMIEDLLAGLLADPEAALCYADVELMDEGGRPCEGNHDWSSKLDPHNRHVVRYYRDAGSLSAEPENFIGSCFLYRAEAARAIGNSYRSAFLGIEDYDFWLRLSKCGPFRHAGNDEPLYKYRVHGGSMSSALTEKGSKKRAIFESSLRDLIELESIRREYSEQRWGVVLDESLGSEQRELLARELSRLPVDIVPGALGDAAPRKVICLAGPGFDGEPPSIRVGPEDFDLAGSSGQVRMWRGIDIDPLASKARRLAGNRDLQFPGHEGSRIVGSHTALAGSRFDVAGCRNLIRSSPSIYFVFIDIPGEHDPELGKALVRGLSNATYLGARPLGRDYLRYACFDAVWAPPASERAPARESLALSYAIGRPFLVHEDRQTVPAPFQYRYRDDLIPALTESVKDGVDFEVMNRYLSSWSKVNRLHHLFRLANAATQDAGLGAHELKRRAAAGKVV